MSQATGGAINMFLVAIFLAVVSGYLAFSVSYNKAFRYKNQIIDSIEQCEGITNSKTDSNTVCVIEKVRAYAKTIGYNNEEINKDGYTCYKDFGFCFKRNSADSDDTSRYYYTVVTGVNINIPIINNFLPSIFEVSGNTRTIKTD